MTCTTDCRKPNGNQAHCGACHRTFSSVSTFDRHRSGHVDDRHCVSPEGVGLRLNHHGVWAGEGRPGFWTANAPGSDDAQTAETPELVPASTPGRLRSGRDDLRRHTVTVTDWQEAEA